MPITSYAHLYTELMNDATEKAPLFNNEYAYYKGVAKGYKKYALEEDKDLTINDKKAIMEFYEWFLDNLEEITTHV